MLEIILKIYFTVGIRGITNKGKLHSTKQKMNEIKKRDYGVFIIEALGSNDLIEGEYLYDVLRAAKVLVELRMVNCKEEFENAIVEFDHYNYRYLHISCHGLKNAIGFDLVNEQITLLDLSRIIKGKMQNRRISLSICHSGRREIAETFIKDGAYSVISHPDAVDANRASLFWTNFYLLMNDEDKWKMKRKHILQFLKSFTKILKIPIHYYSFIREEWKQNLKRVSIDSNGIAKGQKLKVK